MTATAVVAGRNVYVIHQHGTAADPACPVPWTRSEGAGMVGRKPSCRGSSGLGVVP
ncbi:hypothetical protein WJ438_04460 [Streptomyces sp. GD-15H]|uniref:hypothetical protein n=1 Tax=Streptomyces sp. GD-15H TaxID=3129112 RepID=UPI0032482E2C